VLRLLVSQYFGYKGKLYKRMDMDINLLWIIPEEAREIMKEVHGSECRMHKNGQMFAKKV